MHCYRLPVVCGSSTEHWNKKMNNLTKFTQQPRLQSIVYPAKRYGKGFEGVQSKYEEHCKEKRNVPATN